MQNRVSWKFSHDHHDDHLDADDDDGDNDEGDDDDHDSVSSSSPPDVRSWQLAFTLGAILPFCSLALVVMKMMLSDTKGMIMMQRQGQDQLCVNTSQYQYQQDLTKLIFTESFPAWTPLGRCDPVSQAGSK